MLGWRFAVKLISNSQPIYYRGSLSSRVSRALSVFKITLAAHCYWLLLTARAKLHFLMNENKCHLYRVYLPDVCIMHKQIHSMAFFFSFNCILSRAGVRNDKHLGRSDFGNAKHCIWENKRTRPFLGGRFCKHMLITFCFFKLQWSHSVLMSSLLSSRRRCSVSTSRTPCVFMLQPFESMFRIKVCMANAFAQMYLSLAHTHSPSSLRPTISSLQIDPFRPCA